MCANADFSVSILMVSIRLAAFFVVRRKLMALCSEQGRASKIAMWAILAKEPDCRVDTEVTFGFAELANVLYSSISKL